MATKKKLISKTANDATARADDRREPGAKPAVTQAAETAKIVDGLIPSKPATVAVVKTPATTTPDASVTESPAPPVARMPDEPVESVVAKVFQSSPDKEFTVNAVIAQLKQSAPRVNENSIRFTITELKRKSVIRYVRNQGHHQILKLTKPGEERRFPKGPLLDKLNTKSAPKASPAYIGSDLALLKEATAVIVRLQALVHRNQEVLMQISKLRAVL
jgi:hypothetical protein